MILEFKELVFLAVNLVMASSIVITNKMSIDQLKGNQKDLKECLKELQETVNNLRVKVGL